MRLSVCYLIFIASIIYCLTNLTYFNCLSIPLIRLWFFLRSAYMIFFNLYIINFLVMFLAAAHSYLFLCLRLSTECLVSASEQVFNPDEWRGINALYNNTPPLCLSTVGRHRAGVCYVLHGRRASLRHSWRRSNAQHCHHQ